MELKTEGLVLRTTEYKDSDLILTVLSRDHGLLTLKARGVRSNRSKLKSGCQLLAYSEFTVAEHHGFSAISEANAIEMFPELRMDLEKLSLGFYFAQAAEVLSQEDMPNPELLSLTLNALYALAKTDGKQALIKAAFELRLACLAGFQPDVSGCCVCQNPAPDRFLVSHGALSCTACHAGEGIRLPVSSGTLAALRYIVSAPPKRVFSFTLGKETTKELADIAETYLLTQLERGFYTLDYYKSILLQE